MPPFEGGGPPTDVAELLGAVGPLGEPMGELVLPIPVVIAVGAPKVGLGLVMVMVLGLGFGLGFGLGLGLGLPYTVVEVGEPNGGWGLPCTKDDGGTPILPDTKVLVDNVAVGDATRLVVEL